MSGERRSGATVSHTYGVSVALFALLSACSTDKPMVHADGSAAIVVTSVDAPRMDFALTDFALIDQSGKPFQRKDLEGKVWVVDFVFTSCPTVCPELTRSMAGLAKGLGSKDDVGFLSISVDPENDTPAKLREFQSKHGTPHPRWVFLTGDPRVVEETVLKGFKMVLSRSGTGEQGASNIFHAERFVVLDRRAHVRGVFDSKGAGLGALERLVESLLAER